MPMWRCPHCGTPQNEAARCWVCRRSSTTCSTCRHFRRSLAASVGYCGLDRRRAPLQGAEHRGCWTPSVAFVEPEPDEAAAPVTTAPVATSTATSSHGAVTRLRPEPGRRPGVLEGFVPVELVDRGPRVLRPSDGAPVPPPPVVEAVESWADRETLFGEA